MASRTTGATRSAFESDALDAERVNQLVRNLAELMTAHSSDGYKALKHEPKFWQLVSELHLGHIRAEHAKETVYESRNADVNTMGAQVIDVEVAEPDERPDVARSDDGPDDVPSELKHEVASLDPERSQDSDQDKTRASVRETDEGESE